MKTAFGVYVHWPFCLSKCPYCDFNSHVRHAAIDEARHVRAFTAEIAATAHTCPAAGRRSFAAAPSPATRDRRRNFEPEAWSIAPDVEVTLEANPTSVEATDGGDRCWRQPRVAWRAGAQRCRAGDAGRLHTAQEALDAGDRPQGFRAPFFDLIYARPGQTPQAWTSELKRDHEAAEHLLYQLTIEQDTPFAALHAAGKLVTPDEDVARALMTPRRRFARCRPSRLRDLQPCTPGAAGTI
jgi:oxygen-independent coproporphyrinogen-3 oxidase